MKFKWILVVLFFFIGCSQEGPKALKTVNEEDIFKKTVGSLPLKRKEIEGEVDTNPFLSLEEERLYGALSYREFLDLDLTAVFYRPPESKAVINNQILEEGDMLDNKKVIKINPSEVILKDEGTEYIVRLREASENNE